MASRAQFVPHLLTVCPQSGLHPSYNSSPRPEAQSGRQSKVHSFLEHCHFFGPWELARVFSYRRHCYPMWLSKTFAWGWEVGWLPVSGWFFGELCGWGRRCWLLGLVTVIAYDALDEILKMYMAYHFHLLKPTAWKCSLFQYSLFCYK